MRYEDITPDPWEECRARWPLADETNGEFLVIGAEPDRLRKAAHAGKELLHEVTITEFNEEYSDEPIENVDESAGRVASGQAFFLNISGQLHGIGVTISVANDNIALRFPVSEAFPGGRPTEAEHAAFRRLAQAALELAESAGAAAVYFGREGVEIALEGATVVWERGDLEPADTDARSHFSEYLSTLDRRFARKRYQTDDDLARRATAVRAWHWTSGFVLRENRFYFVMLAGAGVKPASIERFARRATASAEHAMGGRPKLGNVLLVYAAVAMIEPSPAIIECAEHYSLHSNFRLTYLIVANMMERRLHSRPRWGWMTSSADTGRIWSGRRMLGFG